MAEQADSPSRPSAAALTWQRQPLDDSIELFALRGELDAGSTPGLRAEVRQLFADGGRHFIVYDLSHVDFVDSVGLGLFFVTHRLCERTGGASSLACPRPEVLETLRNTGITRTMYVAPTRVDAIVRMSRLVHGHDEEPVDAL